MTALNNAGLLDDQNDGTGAILSPFNLPRFGLVAPQKRTGNNQADFGSRDGHPYFSKALRRSCAGSISLRSMASAMSAGSSPMR